MQKSIQKSATRTCLLHIAQSCMSMPARSSNSAQMLCCEYEQSPHGIRASHQLFQLPHGSHQSGDMTMPWLEERVDAKVVKVMVAPKVRLVPER